MYIKIAGYPNRLLPVSGQVEFGSRHWWSNPNGPIVDAGLQDIIDWLDQTADSYDRTNLIDQPAGYKDGDRDKPFWQIRWVRYTSPDESPSGRMLLSTDPVFIVGDDGHTIDKV